MGVNAEAACRTCRVWADFNKSYGPHAYHVLDIRTVADLDRFAAREPERMDPAWFADGAWRRFLEDHQGHDIITWLDTNATACTVEGVTAARSLDDDSIVHDLTGYTNVTMPLWRASGYTGPDEPAP